MLGSKSSIRSLAILTALAASVAYVDPARPATRSKPKHIKPKLKTYVPKMVTSAEQEIANWNAQVAARKQAKNRASKTNS